LSSKVKGAAQPTKRLNVHANTVRRLYERGKLKGFIDPLTGFLFLEEEDIAAYERQIFLLQEGAHETGTKCDRRVAFPRSAVAPRSRGLRRRASR